MRHKSDGERHQTDKHCIFQHQYQNFAYLCKVSIKNGTKFLIFPRNVNISHVTELSLLADVPLEGEHCSTVTLCTVNNNIIAEHCIFQITLMFKSDKRIIRFIIHEEYSRLCNL